MNDWQFLVCIAAVVTGSFLQGALGIGLGILAAPILALLMPSTIPGPMLTSAFLLSVLVVIRDRRDLDFSGASVALVGRLPGTFLGFALLVTLSGSPWLKVSLGALLLGCVVLASLRGRLDVSPSRAPVFFAGLLSGISGTAAGVGGPPVALVWSSLPPKRLRATLAAYFLVGTGFSATLLMIGDQFGSYSALLWMLPATVLGFSVSGNLGDRIDKDLVFKVVILLSGGSSVLLLLRGLRGVI